VIFLEVANFLGSNHLFVLTEVRLTVFFWRNIVLGKSKNFSAHRHGAGVFALGLKGFVFGLMFGMMFAAKSVMAQTAAPGAPKPNAFEMFAPIVFIFVVFYFFLIRPQVKRQK
jgi:hypothetical protein